jgi:hypothetical protein
VKKGFLTALALPLLVCTSSTAFAQTKLSAALTTASVSKSPIDLISIIGPEVYNSDARFNLVDEPVVSEDLFWMLLNKMKLDYVVADGSISRKEVVPPSTSTTGKLLQETLDSEGLELECHESGFIWLLPKARAAKTASLAAARQRTREWLGQAGYSDVISIMTPPHTNASDLITLLAERRKIRIVLPQNMKVKVRVIARKKPYGALLDALLETMNLQLRKTGDNIFTAEPIV